MKTKLFASALAMAVVTAGFAPTEVTAKPPHKHYKKAYKHHRKVVNHYHRPYYRNYDRDYKSENFGIYTTPTGGLGFHFSENRGSYGYPGYYW